MKKSKHTLKSFFLKSIIYAVSAITITCVIVGVYSFSTIDGYINKMAENKLADISIAAATVINGGDELFNLESGQETSPIYQRYLAKFREIRDKSGIKYIYIAKKDASGNTVFVIDADEEVPNPIGVEYEADDEIYRERAFAGNHVISEVEYNEEYGHLISGYAPIKDDSGNIIAILGADYSMDILQDGIYDVLAVYLLICVIVTVVIALIFSVLESFEYFGSKRALTESINKIKSISEEIGDSSKNLQRGNNTLSDNTNSSLSAVNEMSATMDETSSMIKQNNDNTQKASEYFRTSTAELQSSVSKMEELNISITSIKDSSAEICKIIELINSIAKKTKILALNAEVEAARVGEAGKGFTVVAQEVEELAISSEDAAQSINDMISHNIQLTEKAVRDSSSVNEALSSVTRRLMDFSAIINEVSMASSEQEKGVQHLTSATSMIERTVTSNAGLANEIKSSADTLIEITDDLNRNIDRIEGVLGAKSDL